MNKKLILGTMLVSLLLPAIGSANQSTQQLGICLTDSLNGKERKVLARWIFQSMAAHEEIKPYANVSAADLDDTNRFVGELITRLMTEDCPKQTSLAIQESGSLAVQNAFRVVGEVAMQELMTDSNVANSMGAFEKYLDQEKFNRIFQ